MDEHEVYNAMTKWRPGPWFLCSLLFAATALSFLDRQALSMLAPEITAEFAMSNAAYSMVVFAFQLSYTIMFTLGGYLLDRIGTRIGLALSLGVWSLASFAHGLASSPLGLGIARFLLGMGEGGCFPAATKGATEWFPPAKRASAIGYANGGSALGAVIAPPLTALLALHFGWRGAFFATGSIGFVWLLIWLFAYKESDPVAEQSQRSAIKLEGLRGDSALWCILGARFLFDPVFYFYMFWIPQYLAHTRRLSLTEIGDSLWIPFLVLGFSQIFGGRLADLLASQGMAPLRSKTTLLAISAFLTMTSYFVPLASNLRWAIALISFLLFAHGIWITNFLGLLSDLFPSSAIATVTGLTGTAGGIGAMLSSLVIGRVVDRFSFAPLFAMAGILYPSALAMLFWGVALRSAQTRLSDNLQASDQST